MERTGKNEAFKKRLAKLVAKVVEAKGWNRREAAYKLDICESALSNIITGQIKRYKVDWLMDIMFNLGYEAEITFNKI